MYELRFLIYDWGISNFELNYEYNNYIRDVHYWLLAKPLVINNLITNNSVTYGSWRFKTKRKNLIKN